MRGQIIQELEELEELLIKYLKEYLESQDKELEIKIRGVAFLIQKLYPNSQLKVIKKISEVFGFPCFNTSLISYVEGIFDNTLTTNYTKKRNKKTIRKNPIITDILKEYLKTRDELLAQKLLSLSSKRVKLEDICKILKLEKPPTRNIHNLISGVILCTILDIDIDSKIIFFSSKDEFPIIRDILRHLKDLKRFSREDRKIILLALVSQPKEILEEILKFLETKNGK